MCEHRPSTPVSRRDAIRAGLGAAAALTIGPRTLRAATRATDDLAIADGTSLDSAVRAARWIDRSAVRTPRGVTWPADPRDAKSVQANLYTGTPGVVLFFLELGRATGDARWTERACAGADWLAATLPARLDPADEGAGLYTGAAGIAFTLAETARLSGRARYRDEATRALALLRGAAQSSGAGASWNESNDIISGTAGIGLTFLWAHRALGAGDETLALATKAGRRLLDVAKPSHGGFKWYSTPSYPRTMPNFSHGAAGVSYFLATLHEATGDRAFLDGALGGAHYLQAVATATPNDGRAIFHDEPGNETLFYLSWCHGPAGTARLFHRLALVTGDASWARYVDALARGTLASGIPAERTPGFWQNISQCCGNCGVAELMLAMDARARTSDARAADRYREIARGFIADTMSRATAEGDGLKWVQAENRSEPENLVAQTGLMQGAAGVGLALLHLDGAERGRARAIVLPDDPWGSARQSARSG